MHNPEKLVTHGTQDTRRRKQKTIHVLDTTIQKTLN